MDPLSVGVGALAAAFGVSRAVGMFRRNVSGAMFTRIALEQINKGNVERLRRICQAIPTASYPLIARATIEATTLCDAEHGRGLVEQTLRDSFKHAYHDEMSDAAHWAWLAPVAVALGLGAIFLALTAPGGSNQLALIPGIVGVVSAVWAIFIHRRIKRDPITLGVSIVESLVDHVMRTTGDPARPSDPDIAVDQISRGLGLRPLAEHGERTVPAGVTTIAATRARVSPSKRSDVFDMRRGNCGMCGHDDVAIIERGPLKAYVCKGCGFAQWFADDPSSLDG